MDIYIATNINLLQRLSKEAHEANISLKRYISIAKGISDILDTILKYHGAFYLRHIVYSTSFKLGHAVGPINHDIVIKLIKNGCIVTKIIYI